MTFAKVWGLRRSLSPMGTVDAVEFLVDWLKLAETNEEFVVWINACGLLTILSVAVELSEQWVSDWPAQSGRFAAV